MKRAKQHALPSATEIAARTAAGLPAVARRNHVARSPLLGKGGAHGKTRAAERRKAKVALARAIREGES